MQIRGKRIHIREKGETTHTNGKLVFPIIDTSSSTTMIDCSVVTNSDEVENKIENRHVKLSWRKTDTDTTDTGTEICMVLHPSGKHLHSPFIEEAQCNYHKKEEIKEEAVTLPCNIGYGYHRTAGWLMSNNKLNLPVDNGMGAKENIADTECNTNETIDDTRRGAKTLEDDWIW